MLFRSNIEISLKNKITRLKRKIKDIDNSGKTLATNEESLHEEIKELKKKISRNEKYIKVLEVKKTNNEGNDYYINMLNLEANNIKELKDILENKTNEYNDILKELELNNQAKNELTSKLENEESRLKDVVESLTNPNAYIDEDLKNSDEIRLASLENELDKLQKRELELLTDASVIGADAKELIATNDVENALQKVKELVTIVKTKPYMDINNAAILDEELEKKESLRIELAGLIDSKNYEGINSEAIKERIEYLNKEIESNNEKAAKLKNEIIEIDEHISTVLGKKIDSLEKEIIEAEKIVQDYKDLLKTKENTSKTKINLEQAIVKKQKEIQVIDNILNEYKETLVNKINDTNILNERVSNIEAENSRYLKELGGLQKITLINFQTKDLIEEEKDKEDLRKINEEIKQIKSRKQFDKSPNEIYDLIEMTLASVKPVASLSEEKEQNIDNILDQELNELDNKVKSEENVDVNLNPEVEIVNEVSANEELDVVAPVENLEAINNTPNIDEVINEVIEEVPVVENKKEEQEVQNDNNESSTGGNNLIKVVDIIPVETIKKTGGNE